MKRLTAISFLLMVFFAVQAQMQDPVKFKSELKTGSGPEAEMIFSATIDPGWHVYSTNLGQDGPIEASLHVNKKDGVELVGKLTPKGKEISQYDEMFGMKLRYFENAVQFVQKVKFTKPQYDIDAYLEWGACNDEMCMPPGEVVLKKSGKSPAVETSPKEGRTFQLKLLQRKRRRPMLPRMLPLFRPTRLRWIQRSTPQLLNLSTQRVSGDRSFRSCVRWAAATALPTVRCGTSC